MNLLKRIKRSFATRFSLYILFVVCLFFVTVFTVYYVRSSRTLFTEVEDKTTKLLQISNLEITNVLSQTERIPDNIKLLVMKYDIPDDSLFSITYDIVKNNEIVYGCAIAFEPDYFPKHGHYFSPYSVRSGDSINTTQLGNTDYDYFSMDWYIIPKLLKKPYWTEPYFEQGVTMTTYSSPMYDKHGKFIGIFTIDVALEWLSDVMNNNKPYPNAYNFVIGQGGTYILHQQKKYIFNASIFSLSLEKNNKDIYEIGQNMVDGKSGTKLINDEGIKYFVIYSPIPNVNWSSAFVCPYDEVFANLKSTRMLFIIFGIISLLITFVVCYLIIKKLVKPIHSFSISANEIASGNLNATLPVVTSEDEIKDLHNAFENMQNDLTNYIDTLRETTSAKEKIESELRIAHEIQMGMIPKIFPPYPSRNDIDIFATLTPAKEVGGDLYDFFIDSEDRLFFTIGDVSGKGIPASLLMAVTRSLFRTVSASNDVSKIAHSINMAISENNDSNMFVTMFIGILDLNTGHLSFCNAGHNSPIIIRNDNSVIEIPVVPNLPIGIIKEFEFEAQSLDIPTNTSIFLYTDGLTEAENADHELYGDDRLTQCLKDIGYKSVIETIGLELNDVHSHVKEAPQSDDLTMLCINYKKIKRITRTIIIDNNIEEINKLHAFVDTLKTDLNLPNEVAMQLDLALEEIVSNVILYAYKGLSNKNIEIIADKDEEKDIIFTVIDSGIPFDPTKKEDPDITLSVEERPIGGLGVFIMKQIMDEIEYKRIDDKNVLKMKKKLSK